MAAKPPGDSAKPSGQAISLIHGRSEPSAEQRWHRASQIAQVGLFIIALLWCAYIAQHVIVPVLLAWTIATIVLPAVKWMEQHRVPRALAALAVTALLLVIIVTLLLLLSAPLAYWLGRATYVGALLREKLQGLSQPMALLRELQKGLNAIGAGSPDALKVEPQTSSIISTIMSVVTPAVSGFVIFIFSLIFYLIYRPRLRACTKAARNGLPSGPLTVPEMVAAIAAGDTRHPRTPQTANERADDRMALPRVFDGARQITLDAHSAPACL